MGSKKLESGPVTVEDHTTHRVVGIDGAHFHCGVLVPCAKTYTTTYSKQLVDLLLAAKGSLYLMDEISREADPKVLRQYLEKHILTHTSLNDKHVLDFGSGCGASSIQLARMGAHRVTGVEIEGPYVKAAVARAEECRVADRVRFFHAPDTTALPFSDAAFDVASCSAVIEHIPPKDRRPILREIWRTLRVGGFLFIRGTPNRLWPIDHHTTGLPLVPYLPLGLARQFAIRFSKRVDASQDVKELIVAGIRGSTFWEIKGALPSASFVQRNPVQEFFSVSSIPLGLPKRSVRNAFWAGYTMLDRSLCKLLRIPVMAFLPELRLVIKKGAP